MQIIKYTFWLLFLILSGCNETDVPVLETTPSQAIHFSTRIQTLTTKSIITETTLPDNSQIGIFSWGHHKNEGSANTTLRKDLANTLYTKEAGNDELVALSDQSGHPTELLCLLSLYIISHQYARKHSVRSKQTRRYHVVHSRIEPE